MHDGTGLVASYAYDAFNRRVAKTVGGTTTETVWTGWQALEEYTTGVLSARRSFGLGLDEMVRVEADVEGDGTLESTYHPIYDSTGNLVMVLGLDGEPIELYAYSPNGERRVIVNDLTPPLVEQVRVSGGAVVVELSEEVDTEVLEAAVAGGEVTLTDLTDPGTPAAVPFTASWPVTEGRQARRRLVLTPGTAPAAGTALELSVAAEALEDLFGNATTAASTDAFTWPSGDAIVRDATAPRIESVSVEQGSLVVVLSEPADPAAAAAAIDLDGQPLTWTLGADGYTLTSQEIVAEGSHTVDIGTGPLDLAGLGLAQAFQESFVLAEDETGHLVYERPDPTLSTTSTIANRYGFHGRPVDPETGFLYFRNRYYDPELGRFVSVDPLGYVDGPNLYQYALNNPSSFSDPMGLCKGEPGDPEECVDWWPYWPPGVAAETQEDLDRAARNPELGRLERALYGAQAWWLGVGASAEEEGRHLLNLPHHIFSEWRRRDARVRRWRELEAELGCGPCFGEDLGTIFETLEAEGLMGDEPLGPGVAQFPMGPGRLGRLERGTLQLIEPRGRKLAQQIARFRAAGGTGGRAEFMQHATDLAARAREAGSFVTGTVGRGPQAIPNATIFREGSTYLVVDEAGVIRSYVSDASPGGIVDEFVRLGGSQ